ncbi:MAG: TolC family protein, partial [Muribaculaceae bacterium]|nr:TolC family protein [Muribaculaceae bacterium]
AKGAIEANLPDPEVEGEFLAAPPGEQNRWGAGISWGLDWPGVYSARKNLAKAESEVSLWKAKAEQRDLGIEARRLLLDYILQAKQIKIIESLILTTDTISELAIKANKGGEMTLLDLNKLRLEATALKARLSAANDAKAQAAASLAGIAGHDCTDLLEKMDKEFPSMSGIETADMASMIASSPQMREAHAMVKLADEEKRVASREALPGINFGYKHAFEDGNHFNGGSIGLSLPLFSSKGKMKAAKASRKAAEIAAEEIRINSETSAQSALRRMNILNEEIKQVAPLLEGTDNQTILLKAYKAGVITLIDYLNERNYFLEATVQLLELRHAAANAVLDVLAVK